MEDSKLTIVRVEDATALVSDLFMRSFGEPPPTFPSHYVAFYQTAPSTFQVIGYYHVTHQDEYALLGGLCVDTRVYRKIASAAPRAAGGRKVGVADRLNRAVFEDAGDKKAYFAYTGNSIARGIGDRDGFAKTGHEHLLVKWLQDLDEDEKKSLVDEVARLGPF